LRIVHCAGGQNGLKSCECGERKQLLHTTEKLGFLRVDLNLTCRGIHHPQAVGLPRKIGLMPTECKPAKADLPCVPEQREVT
jgi:hypothetical protein